MECPVCGNAAADDIPSQTIDGDAFRCPTCGEYQISGSVYSRGLLKSLELSKRKDALARAQLQASPGKLPCITVYDL